MITSVVSAGIPGAQRSNHSALGLRQQQENMENTGNISTLRLVLHWEILLVKNNNLPQHGHSDQLKREQDRRWQSFNVEPSLPPLQQYLFNTCC